MAADPPPLLPVPSSSSSSTPPDPAAASSSTSSSEPPIPPPPSHAEIFHLIASGSAPISPQDPRISLRPRSDLTPIEHDPNSWDRSSDSDDDEPHTLSEFRDSEGSVHRLSRLRSLFDSIPIPSSPPASPVASTSALPPTGTSSAAEDERARCEADRKIYARELWRKCNGSPVVASSTGMELRDHPPTPPSPPIPSTLTTTATHPSSSTSAPPPTTEPRPRVASAAVRWTAFERYAEEKEKELWKVFVELDSDGDMRLRPAEVREACARAGLEVKEGTLDDFMRTVDKDGDGAISFAEWRDFLLLLPRPTSMPEIFKYYQTHRQHRPSMSRLTQDGDVVIGGGKTGWNRLMSKSAAASASKSVQLKKAAAATAVLQDATNLRKHETENDEKRWARECVECVAQAKAGLRIIKKGKEKTASAATVEPTSAPKSVATASTTTDPATTNASASTKAVPSSQASSMTTKTVDTAPTTSSMPFDDAVVDEDDEEPVEAQHGMFSGAGKFLLAGGLAGAVSRTATAPFDRLKVYLITSPSTYQAPPPRYVPSLGSPESAAPDRPPKKVRRGKGSIPAAVRTIWRQGGGPKAFWTGNGLNVIKIFPESAIKFLSYESAKRVFAQYWDCVPDQTMISNSSRFVAGGIGGVISQFVIYPIETLKTRVMSSTGGEFKGNVLILKTAQNIWRKGGVRLYFRGLPAGLIGVFPYSAIDMSTFEGIKLAYTKWAGEEPGIPGSLLFGAFSGGVGATSVYPLNLVRTRLQAQGTLAHPQTYTGVRDAARKCYQREGWRGFYKGLTPTLVKVVPAVAISYAVYDASKKVLFGREEQCHTAHHEDDAVEE